MLKLVHKTFWYQSLPSSILLFLPKFLWVLQFSWKERERALEKVTNMPHVFLLSLHVCLEFFSYGQNAFISLFDSWGSETTHDPPLVSVDRKRGIHTVLAKTGEAGEVKWLSGPWEHHQARLSVTITLWPSHLVHGPGARHVQGVQGSLAQGHQSPEQLPTALPRIAMGAAKPGLTCGLAQPRRHGPGSPHHTSSWHGLQLPHSMLEINTKMLKQHSVCPEHFDLSSENNNCRKCNKWVGV